MPEPVIAPDEKAVRGELKELARGTVEDALNALFEEEVDDLAKADRYERTADCEAHRAGHCERGLTATSGEAALRMPELKGMRFATAIIERRKHRETSVEEVVAGMRLADVSTRRIEDVSGILRGAGAAAGIASNLNARPSKLSRNGGAGP